MRIVWSPRSRERVHEAITFIQEDRPEAALTWLEGLIDRIELLRDLPEQGRVVPEWGDPGIREILYEPYRVIDERFDDRVEILTLSHERQQLHRAP